MPLWFPRRSFYGDGGIDAFSFDALAEDDKLTRDPVSVRFRSDAENMLRGIHRCVAKDRELQDGSEQVSIPDAPVLDDLGDSLPKLLDFVSDKPLPVSDVPETSG